MAARWGKPKSAGFVKQTHMLIHTTATTLQRVPNRFLLGASLPRYKISSRLIYIYICLLIYLYIHIYYIYKSLSLYICINLYILEEYLNPRLPISRLRHGPNRWRLAWEPPMMLGDLQTWCVTVRISIHRQGATGSNGTQQNTLSDSWF